MTNKEKRDKYWGLAGKVFAFLVVLAPFIYYILEIKQMVKNEYNVIAKGQVFRYYNPFSEIYTINHKNFIYEITDTLATRLIEDKYVEGAIYDNYSEMWVITIKNEGNKIEETTLRFNRNYGEGYFIVEKSNSRKKIHGKFENIVDIGTLGYLESAEIMCWTTYWTGFNRTNKFNYDAGYFREKTVITYLQNDLKEARTQIDFEKGASEQDYFSLYVSATGFSIYLIFVITLFLILFFKNTFGIKTAIIRKFKNAIGIRTANNEE